MNTLADQNNMLCDAFRLLFREDNKVRMHEIYNTMFGIVGNISNVILEYSAYPLPKNLTVGQFIYGKGCKLSNDFLIKHGIDMHDYKNFSMEKFMLLLDKFGILSISSSYNIEGYDNVYIKINTKAPDEYLYGYDKFSISSYGSGYNRIHIIDRIAPSTNFIYANYRKYDIIKYMSNSQISWYNLNHPVRNYHDYAGDAFTYNNRYSNEILALINKSFSAELMKMGKSLKAFVNSDQIIIMHAKDGTIKKSKNITKYKYYSELITLSEFLIEKFSTIFKTYRYCRVYYNEQWFLIYKIE